MIKLRPPKQTVCPAPRQTVRSAVSWPCAFFAPPKKNKKKKSPIPIADFPALLTRAAPFGDAAKTGGAKPRCQARRNNAESARPNGAKPSTRQASVNRARNPKAAPPAARACLARPSTAARQAWDRPHPLPIFGRRRRLAVETPGNQTPVDPHLWQHNALAATSKRSVKGILATAAGEAGSDASRPPQASGASPPRPTPGAKVNAPQTNRAARPGAKMTQTRPQLE